MMNSLLRAACQAAWLSRPVWLLGVMGSEWLGQGLAILGGQHALGTWWEDSPFDSVFTPALTPKLLDICQGALHTHSAGTALEGSKQRVG